VTKLYSIVAPFTILSLFVTMTIGYFIGSLPLTGISAIILFGWLLIAWSIEEDERRREWDEHYAQMTDRAKIDYHLDRARRYGSNADANIAQALIARKR
jgi:hypothetical protein